MTIAIVITAVITVLIYRLGLCDGQTMSKGERLNSTVKIRHKESDEDEKIKRGIKNILDFGLEE